MRLVCSQQLAQQQRAGLNVWYSHAVTLIHALPPFLPFLLAYPPCVEHGNHHTIQPGMLVNRQQYARTIVRAFEHGLPS